MAAILRIVVFQAFIDISGTCVFNHACQQALVNNKSLYIKATVLGNCG